MGMMADVFQLNDLAVNACKVSGTGAGEIGDSVVFVGNVMRDFDPETMSRVINSPAEAFRIRFREAMRENMTHIRGALGEEARARWTPEAMQKVLADSFRSFFGGLEPAEIDALLREEMDRLGRKMLDPAFVRFKRKSKPGRVIKVRAGYFLHHHATEDGMSAVYALEDGLLRGVEIQGPGLGGGLSGALAKALEGADPKVFFKPENLSPKAFPAGLDQELFAKIGCLFQ